MAGTWRSSTPSGRVSPLGDVADVSDLAWSPDGARIAIRHGSTVSVIDVASGRSDTILRAVDGADVGQLAWSGDRLAIGASDRTPGVEPSQAPGSIRIVDLGTGAERDVQVGPHGWVDNVTWLPDGRIVFTDATGPIYVVDPEGDTAPTPSHPWTAWQPVLSPDGRSIVYETLGGAPDWVCAVRGSGRRRASRSGHAVVAGPRVRRLRLVGAFA